MARLLVTLADDLWLWRDDDGWHLAPAPAGGHPGAYEPRPKTLKAGTELDIEVWHAGCAGCKALREMKWYGAAGAKGEIVSVEHTHGVP